MGETWLGSNQISSVPLLQHCPIELVAVVSHSGILFIGLSLCALSTWQLVTGLAFCYRFLQGKDCALFVLVSQGQCLMHIVDVNNVRGKKAGISRRPH